MAKAESGMRAEFARVFKQQGWLVDSNPASASTGRGRSDLTLCVRGRFVAVEVKMPGELPTPSQRRYLDKVVSAGGIGIVSSNPDQAVILIQQEISRQERRFEH